LGQTASTVISTISGKLVDYVPLAIVLSVQREKAGRHVRISMLLKKAYKSIVTIIHHK